MNQIVSCHSNENHTNLFETRFTFSFLKLKIKIEDIKAFNKAKDLKSIQASENVYPFLLSSEVEPLEQITSITFTSVDSSSAQDLYCFVCFFFLDFFFFDVVHLKNLY